MTPQEIKAEIDAITDSLGSNAYVSVTISSCGNWDVKGFIQVNAYPHGVSRDEHRISAKADTFEVVFSDLREKLVESQTKIHAATIRKLALAIITTTADLGECSDAALRGAGFSQDEIDQHGEAACSEATRMASGGPFEIVRHNAFANAAE